ncbi:MAG: FkbM family methyltransferase [Saprospirales bacterium]|nr:FkbM family methyltransferase [Saprospirales bacterium]
MLLRKIAKLNPTVIFDGGANIGKYSLLVNSVIPGCEIHSFEPVTLTFQILKKNIKNFDNITPVNKGLYKENCKKEINIFNSSTHSSIYDIQGLSYAPKEKAEIELIRGDDYVAAHQIAQIDLLKLDVEGAEYEALQGFKNCIEAKKIRVVQFEYGYINISTKNLLIDFYNFFQSNGYRVGKIFPKIVEFRDYEFKYEDFLGPNFIAVSESDDQLIQLLSKK